MKKHIGNVGIFDFRGATKEVVDKIAGVGNVGMMIISKAVKPLLADLHCGNMGAMYEVEEDTRLITGAVDLDRETLIRAEKPLSYLVNGRLTIAADVTPEDIEKGLGKLWINGLVVCPKSCIPAVRERLEMANGQVLPLQEGQKIVLEKLELTGTLLESMTEPVRYFLLGEMTILEDFDPKLLEKIESIRVHGRLKLRQRYFQALGERFEVDGGVDIKTKLPSGLDGRIILTGGQLEIIPDDAVLINDDIELDAMALQRYDKSLLWCSGRVRFDHDVTPDMLTRHLKGLKCDDIVICRKELRPVLLELLQSQPEMIAYTNDIVVIDGSQSLSAAELKFRKGTFALLVAGQLTVEPDVDPQALHDRIEFIVNHGRITCHGDMCGALRAKMRENKGKVVDAAATEDKPKDDKEYLVENAGVFTL